MENLVESRFIVCNFYSSFVLFHVFPHGGIITCCFVSCYQNGHLDYLLYDHPVYRESLSALF
jgi:hypothetical protein